MRILNKTGVDRFRDFLEDSAANGGEIPLQLLDSKSASEVYPKPLSLDSNLRFENKLDFAKYLSDQFERASIKIQEISHDSELWTTIILLYFDQFCPINEGNRDVKFEKSSMEKFPKYIPQRVTRAGTESLRGRRHYAYGPFLIYNQYKDSPHKADFALSGKLHVWGEDIEQVVGRSEVLTNKNLMSVIRTLYWDEQKGRLKPGYSTRTKPGNLRRLLGDIRSQMEKTYDWQSMPTEQIVSLLPEEFEQWLE